MTGLEYDQQLQMLSEAQKRQIKLRFAYNRYIVGICAGMLMVLLSFRTTERVASFAQVVFAGSCLCSCLCILSGVIVLYGQVLLQSRTVKFHVQVVNAISAGRQPPLTDIVKLGILYDVCSIANIVLFCLFVLGLASYIVITLF